ncbi:MAG: c-type cytochrome [Desulfuromonadales bacterium]|nr:c-type cytochrome [Desulfuromonadales bacterium]
MRTLVAITCFISICGLADPGWGAQSSGDEAMARRLLNSQGCKACHRFEGGTTQTGPRLNEISKNLNRTELYRKLVNPEKQHGNGLIPDFSHLQDDELDALVIFLHSLLPEGQKTTPGLSSGSKD